MFIEFNQSIMYWMQQTHKHPINFLIIFLVLTLIQITTAESGPANWFQGVKIWAGQTKAINMTLRTPGTYTGTQTYAFINFTFSSPPKPLLGLEGYKQALATPTTNLGFTISITNTSKIQFNYTCTVYGANMFYLFYKYIVFDQSLTMFTVSYVFKTFTTQNITNSALTPRVTSFISSNNPNQTYNIANQIVMIGFIAGFKFQSGTTGTNIVLTIAPLNSTSHTVTITTKGDTIISEVTYFRLAFDKTIVEDGYTNVVAMLQIDAINSTQQPINYIYPFSNYRTTATGWYRIDIPANQETDFILNVVSLTVFLNSSSMTYNRLTCINFIFTNRSCPNASLPYYYNPDFKCYDVCPAGYVANNTKFYCQNCHYSCLTCNQSSSSSCNTCPNNSFRAFATNLTYGPCLCLTGYYDSGVVNCSTCVSRCLTCSSLSTNCTTCNGNRTLVNNSCPCANGFYDDNSAIGNCILCMRGCTTCTFNTTQTCITCNTTENWILSNGSCICNDGYYYNSSTSKCTPCSIGCKSCSGDTMCSLCYTGNNRELVGTTCNCISTFLSINNSIACSACSYPCGNCINVATYCTSCNGNRTLVNNSCPCANGFYDDNSAIGNCILCMRGCTTCTFNTTQTCITCNTTENWILSNGSCICNDGYYYNSSTSKCTPCSIGCKSCSGDTMCSLCYTGNNRELVGTTCNCISTFLSINNSIACSACSYPCGNCINVPTYCTSCKYSTLRLTNNTCLCLNGKPDDGNGNCQSQCGNGFKQSGQQCDDGNTLNGDGCSSICKVQENHLCQENLTNVSLCYFDKKINFDIATIYKNPFDNLVRLQFTVDSLNCNRDKLKQFLLSNLRRMLLRRMLLVRTLQSSTIALTVQPTSIQSLSYDTMSNYLTLDARYYADVNFNGANINFLPSNSASTNSYFYQTPQSSTPLSAPYNNIATTYISQSQLDTSRVIYYLYLSLIIIFLVLFVMAIIFKKAPIAIQCLYVIDVAYYALASINSLNPIYAGLGQWGKYLNGYNISILSTLQNCNNALAINFKCNLINNINITFWVGFFTLILFFFLRIYNYVKSKNQTKTNYQKSNNLSKINIATIWALEIAFSVGFLICEGYVVSLCFQNNSNLTISIVQAIMIGLFLCLLIANWFWMKTRDDKLMQYNLSYLKMLVDFKTFKSVSFCYYPCLMLCFMLNGVFMIKVGGYAGFVIIMVISVISIIVNWRIKIYVMKINKIRSIANNTCVITICLIFVITINSPSGLLPAILIWTTLLLVLLINVFSVFWIHFFLEKPVKEEEQTQISIYKGQGSNIRPLIKDDTVIGSKNQEQSWKEKIKERPIELKELKKDISIPIKGIVNEKPNTRAQEKIQYIQNNNPEEL